MINAKEIHPPDWLYGKLARFEAKRALDLAVENDKDTDPREILARSLKQSGFNRSVAVVIALDSGSPNVIDDKYLAGIGITDKKAQNIVYREVIRFHLRGIPG